jgi:hypothetical protein
MFADNASEISAPVPKLGQVKLPLLREPLPSLIANYQVADSLQNRARSRVAARP